MASTNRGFHDSISKELGSFIASKSSTFACGGLVPISNAGANETANTSSTSPFALRWDSPGASTGISKLIFPIDGSNDDQKVSLLKLVEDCQPASFGYKGEDVIDESYRKATKLDCTAFSTDFCPYKLGIVDTIAQVLLPNAGSDLGTKGVKAELYKLNIYGAPSGFFKAHVDTPRSDTQFGSLVVCLPCHHEGGQLIVRHAGHSTTFDWGASGSKGKIGTALQWAAFYSDCEHEVLEVTEGHRITLTYNLYFTPGVGDLAGNSPAMDIEQHPLFNKIKAALDDPGFMATGGNLGIFCQHAYAHSTQEGAKALPSILKGVDMAVYSVFKALGLDISVRPIYDLKNDYIFEDYDPDNPDIFINYSMNEEEEDDRKFEKEDEDNVEKSFVGNSCGQVQLTEVGGYDASREQILAEADACWLKVKWLTKPTSRNISFVHLTYGNEAGINALYTHAALVVIVPAASTRQSLSSLKATR